MATLIDPANGAQLFVDLNDVPHVYTYGGPSGAMDTDTITVGSLTFRKTYTYTGSVLTGESKWVKQ